MCNGANMESNHKASVGMCVCECTLYRYSTVCDNSNWSVFASFCFCIVTGDWRVFVADWEVAFFIKTLLLQLVPHETHRPGFWCWSQQCSGKKYGFWVHRLWKMLLYIYSWLLWAKLLNLWFHLVQLHFFDRLLWVDLIKPVLMSVCHLCVHSSVHRKFFRFEWNLVWCRGQWVMDDDTSYDPIQGQGQGHLESWKLFDF